ncbi:unnamed protein product [Parascedosporium putredinis]|uniref:Uncharacterized protein n=1 Tax=Parascedosporium putredinis TaxID=1442378 RepID=A0A9P1H2K7_9PEZI|nr:unnamed protein product [Parascedosporium putredinis]CAI7993761.1 unnamed protein product [Parascedosporium putredinis]
MRSGRKIDEEDPSILDPIFRSVDFSDTRGVAMMEPADGEMDAAIFDSWLHNLHGTSLDEAAANATDETEDLERPLRREIIQFWKLVHSDVLEFLNGATGYCGKRVRQEYLRVPFTGAEGAAAAAPRSHDFGTNVLVIPAFVAEGAAIRITRDAVREKGTEAEVGVFDLEENPFDIFYLRRGFQYNFYVKGQGRMGRLRGIVREDDEGDDDLNKDDGDDGENED